MAKIWNIKYGGYYNIRYTPIKCIKMKDIAIKTKKTYNLLQTYSNIKRIYNFI